ncbi:hypothetical protein OIU84_017742 [Salix udensis]|uniref:Uncharacterized protein n=1 Tax=Salix udensis TaxID=889485 RepID=A0AAD6L2J0_9ROSI|nr:hypothetical protein OIU84_017742 [Salix udensis]
MRQGDRFGIPSVYNATPPPMKQSCKLERSNWHWLCHRRIERSMVKLVLGFRLAQDNRIVAGELLFHIRRIKNKDDALALKINLEMAYYRVDWGLGTDSGGLWFS